MSGGGATAMPPAPVPASQEVVQLRGLVARLSAVDPVELPAAQALTDARELLAVRAQMDALILRRLGDVDTRKLHQLDASPTTTAWVRAQDAEVAPRP